MALDYALTLNQREFAFEWGLPSLVSCTTYILLRFGSGQYYEVIENLNSSILNALSVLLGFSMASVILLITSNSQSITTLKSQNSKRAINKKTIKLYQLILITFTFLMIMELFEIFINIMNQIISGSFDHFAWREFGCFNLFIMLHVIFLNTRNLVNIYMTLFHD